MEKLVKTSAVAALFGVTSSTVSRWIRAGKVEAIKTEGGHYRISRAEVDKLMERSRDPWRL